MKTIRILLSGIIFLVPIFLLAYTWDLWGPQNIDAGNFTCAGTQQCCEFICESEGFYVMEYNWVEYSYGNLPVIDVLSTRDISDSVLVALGYGSNSDGIYFFDLSEHEFSISHWHINPHFFQYCEADSSYYTGGWEGLAKSADASFVSWQQVVYFSGNRCNAMASFGAHYVIAAQDDVHYSDDAGTSWNSANTGNEFSQLACSAEGIIYAVYPGESWSSGLYSSLDYGETWGVEFWSTNLVSCGFDLYGNLAVAWEFPNGQESGVAFWDSDTQELTFMNEGLPCLEINKISHHDMVDCNNIMVCTDEGAYMLTNYLLESSPDSVPEPGISVCCSPNPFNPATILKISALPDNFITVKIYNLKGQMVRNLYRGVCENHSIQLYFDGNNDEGQSLASGLYLYQVTADERAVSGKMLLLK